MVSVPDLLSPALALLKWRAGTAVEEEVEEEEDGALVCIGGFPLFVYPLLQRVYHLY